MININFDKFSLDWVRQDRKTSFSLSSPDGDAFQQLCGDILKAPTFKQDAGLNLELLSFPTLGMDGAIDHYGFKDKNETTIIECKKNNAVVNAHTEIKKLRNKLHENLNKPNAKNTILSPWFNKDLKLYIFCTSCQPSNAAEFEGLKEAIKEMMQHLGGSSALLSHLTNIETKVYTWQQLKGWMERSPFLIYKWVQPGIEGIEVVSKNTDYGEGYRSYLSSNKLPYLSRDRYMQKHPEITDLPSEKQFLEELIHENKQKKGIIIYGEGGIGKTRLMRELALMAVKQGWKPYRVNSYVDIKELVGFLRPEGKYILLFDYIEELPHFHEWIEILTQGARPFEVRIIANCRSSYVQNVRVLHSSQFDKMDISNTTESSNFYYRYVVKEIIHQIPALKDVNKKIFQYRPSFAVFVRYLYDRDKKFDFDIKEEKDFRHWILRRLELSFSRASDVKLDHELLAKMFCCLPSSTSGKEFLEDHHSKEISILTNDGWFEYRTDNRDKEQKQLSVIHDSLADEILLEYLERNKQAIESTVRRFFDFAAKNQLLYGCSRAFERIRDATLLAKIDFVPVFSRLIENYPLQMQPFYYHLVKTPLISETAMLTLYQKHQSFFRPYIESPEFAGPLSYLLNDFTKKGTDESTRHKIGELYEGWHESNKDVILDNPYASKLISTATKFFGSSPTQQKLVMAYLNSTTIGIEASFVIGAWLEAGGDKLAVQSAMKDWLTANGKAFEARFVIGAWLEAGGDKLAVQSAMKDWLTANGKAFEARFVIGAWLEAGGDKLAVQSAMKEWLTANGKAFEAQFVYSAWLEAGGDKGAVQSAMKEWLTANGKSIEARFVIRAWLGAGGDKLAVQSAMKEWLTANGKAFEAQFVFNAWLEAGGDKLAVQSAMKEWLTANGKAFEAQFVFNAWLEAGGDKGAVQSAMKEWLTANGKAFEAQFVFNAWLEAGGDKGAVQSAMKDWLTANGKAIEASFVIGAWLAAGGEKGAVQSAMKEWLTANGKAFEASFVIGAWLKKGGRLEFIQDEVVVWLNIHAANYQASFILNPVLKKIADLKKIEKPFTIWLSSNKLAANSFYNLGLWLKRGGNLDLVRNYVADYCDQFPSDEKAERLLDAWMLAGGEVPFHE